MVGSLGWSCNGCNGCARILKSDTGYQISQVTVGVGSHSGVSQILVVARRRWVSLVSWLCALRRALQAKLTLRLRCCTDAVDVRGFVWLRRRRRRRAAVSATDGDTPREAAVSRLVARAAAGGAPAAEMAAQTVAARSAACKRVRVTAPEGGSLRGLWYKN